MAVNSDPITNNPAIQKWAERFYAVKAWTMPNQGGEDEAVALRRKAALVNLGKIAIGSDLMSGTRRAFDGGRKAIHEAINGATTEDDFNPIDGDIVTLASDIAAQIEVAKARVVASDALKEAEVRFAALSNNLDEGAFTFLSGKLRDVQGAQKKAVSKSDFEDAENLGKDFLLICTGAETYGKFFDNWTLASAAFIAKDVPKPQQAHCMSERGSLMAAATSLSGAGDFAKARQELEKLGNDPDIDSGKFLKSQEFTDAYNTYMANSHDHCQTVLACDIDGVSTYRNHLKSAKKLGFTDGDCDAAVLKLKDLVDWCSARKKIAVRMRRFDNASKKFKEFRDAMSEMNTEQMKGNIDAALKILSKLEKNAEVMKFNFSSQISKKLKQRFEALEGVITDPELSDLQDTWKAHEQAVSDKDFDKASTYVAKLNDLFKLEKMVDLRAELAQINTAHPGAAAYDYQKGFTDEMAKPDYAKALVALKDAMPLIRKLAAYLDTKAEVEALKLAIPDDPPELRATLDTALNDADIKAMAKDPDGAANDLRTVLSGSDYLDMALALADYAKLAAVVAKRQPKVKKLLGLAVAEKAIDDSLDAARALADPGGKYGEAYLALLAHEKLLTLAQAFGAARRQVDGVMKGLLRAAKTNLTLLDPAPATQEGLQKKIVAAEKLAGKADFTDAQAAFDDVLNDCKALSTKAAKFYEATDGVGSNAGHSLDRHGPDVTDPELITRLKTGTPPNAKTPDEKSHTGASSKFESPQDWLAGRELAADAALKLPPGKRVDIEATSIAPPFEDAPESAAFTVEHGRAIDKAFIGKKKHVQYDEATQEFLPDKTYETFEEMSGLTRAYVNFIWEPEVIRDVPKLDEDKNIIMKGGVAELEDVKPRSNKEYVDAFTLKNGAAPPNIPGRWVMMQQFPVTEGWDDELKAYTSDPMDLIP